MFHISLLRVSYVILFGVMEGSLSRLNNIFQTYSLTSGANLEMYN